MLLLVGPRRIDVPWRVGSRAGAAVGLLVVAATTEGAVGAASAFGAVVAAFSAGAAAVGDPWGARQHRQ